MLSFLDKNEVEQGSKAFGNDPIAFALSLLPQAATLAVTPVSQFNVAAIAIDKEGNFYIGVNQECREADMGQTVHAEQSAIAHAWQRGADIISDIVVNYTPCGHCRQFLNELRHAQQIKIHLPHSRDQLLQQYLPDSFSPKDLGLDIRLLDKMQHKLSPPKASLDALEQAAFEAANTCYAPYSRAYAGIALALEGKIITGRYAENAAYNPSLPPLQVAINSLRLSGLSLAQVSRAVLCCTAHGGHESRSRELWQALGQCELEILTLSS